MQHHTIAIALLGLSSSALLAASTPARHPTVPLTLAPATVMATPLNDPTIVAIFDAVTTTLLPAIQNAELKDLVVKVAPAFQAHMLAAASLDKKLDNKSGR